MTIPDTTSGIFFVYLHHMRTLLFFVLLLIGLVGYTQTNSHQYMNVTIHTNSQNYLPSFQDIQIVLYEVDTFGVATIVNPNNYTLSVQANQYVFNFGFKQYNQVVVYIKVLPNGRLHNKFLSTFGTSSGSINRATRVIIPNILGGNNTITHHVYMIPKIISLESNSIYID